MTLAALLIAASAFDLLHAQSKLSGSRLERLDADADGVIVRDEVTAARSNLFRKMDLNGDARLDEAEIDELRDRIMDRAMMLQARLGRQWRQMDRDGDDALSHDEFSTSALLFDIGDRNGDGRLSASEFLVIRNLFANAPNSLR